MSFGIFVRISVAVWVFIRNLFRIGLILRLFVDLYVFVVSIFGFVLMVVLLNVFSNGLCDIRRVVILRRCDGVLVSEEHDCVLRERMVERCSICVIKGICQPEDFCRFSWCRLCGSKMDYLGGMWVSCSRCGCTNKPVRLSKRVVVEQLRF